MDYTDIIKRLKDISLADGESSHTHLSAIAGAVYKPTYGWTSSECMNLRDRLVAMAYNARAFDDMDAYVERLHGAAENREDVTINGVDYMSYPADCDGMQIHIGDKVDCGEHFGIREVEGFVHGAVAFTVYDPQPARICTHPAHMTHRPRLTVEDVLKEMLDAVADGSVGYDEAASKYAEILRFKEEDE